MNYKGTTSRISVGDKVLISKAWAKKLRVGREGVVTELNGFITVLLNNGDEVDFDARSLSLNSEIN